MSSNNINISAQYALACLCNHITQYNLACLYLNGEKSKKNLENTFYWFQKAAENGNELAIYNLALLYEKTEQSLEKSLYWYQKIAENGNERIQYKLACI